MQQNAAPVQHSLTPLPLVLALVLVSAVGIDISQKKAVNHWFLLVFWSFLSVFWSKNRKIGHFFVNQRLIEIGI